MRIGNRAIGDNHPAFIIAEAGINHNGMIDVAKKLVDLAVEAGADAIKFQMRDFETLYTESALDGNGGKDIATEYLLSKIKDASLSPLQFEEIADYCGKKGIIFLCTPWDKKSADILEKIGVPAYKVASADLVNFELLEHLASKKKPIIISTGMSTMEEIKTSVDFLNKLDAEFAVLHCNSTYPSAPKDLNLRFIPILKETFGKIIGYSGHELGIATTLATIPLGAKIIERHITLDRTMTGPDHAISLEPAGIIKLVRDIRRIEEALSGDKKYVTSGEFMNRKILGKSLTASRDIKKGETIKKEMVTAKSPAKGLSPQKIFDLIGKPALRDLKKNDYFTDHDLGKIKTEKKFPKGSWGIPVRPHDFLSLKEGAKPSLLEFHLSSEDVSRPIAIPEQKKTELVVHAPERWGNDLFDLCSKEKKAVEVSIKNLNHFLEIVRKMKKSFPDSPQKTKVIVHAGGMSYNNFVSPEERKEMYKILSGSLKKIKSKNDIEILLENLPPYPWYKGGQWFSNAFMDADEICDFCRKNKIRMCYDTSHAELYCNFAKKDSLDFFKKIKPLIRHMHIADGAGVDGEGLQIGEGDIPWEKLIPEIKKAKAGFIPEIWMGHEHQGEGFWKALEELKKLGL